MSGKDVDVNLDNIKLDIDSDTYVNANLNSSSDIDVTSNSNIKVDTSDIRTELVLPQPLKTESRFAITEPIVSQSSSDIGLDIRPMVMDFCFKFEFGKLPPACIRKPYQHHFGITLFGMEILGFNLSGESRVIIGEVQKQPQVAWGGEGRGSSKGDHPSKSHAGHDSLRIRLES
jgi:hypothetical protein